MPILSCVECQEQGLNSKNRCAVCAAYDAIQKKAVSKQTAINEMEELAASKNLIVIADDLQLSTFLLYYGNRLIMQGPVADCIRFLNKYVC